MPEKLKPVYVGFSLDYQSIRYYSENSSSEFHGSCGGGNMSSAREIELGAIPTQALHWVLAATECKKRSDARMHRKIYKEMRKECMHMESEFRGLAVGGTIALDEEQMKYIQRACDKRFDSQGGIPGEVAAGVDELLDIVEEELIMIVKSRKDAEKAGEGKTGDAEKK